VRTENQYLFEHYSNNDEDARLASRHGSVEFLTTMRYIEKYLKPGDRIIETGAATGRYSHALAQAGYEVDAVELVPHNIEVFKAKTQPGEKITITEGNALDLSGFASNTYDITLLLGPLYHMYNQKDKRQALGEAIRVTKPGGVVFAAYILSDGCILDSGFRRGAFDVAEFMQNGYFDSETFAASSEPKLIVELIRPDDIDELMAAFPATKRLHLVASDGYAIWMREAVDAMDDAQFGLYLRYHFATCERGDLIGMSSHALDVFRKNSS